MLGVVRFMRVLNHTTLGMLLLVASIAGAAMANAAEKPTPEQRPPGSFKLLTWNIQMLPTFPNVEKLRKKQALRAPWIVDYLNAQDYDVVVLQEVIDHKMTALIKDGLKASYPYLVAAEPRQSFTACAGGILIAGRIPIKYVGYVTYQHITGADAMAEKGCLLVEGEWDGIRFQIAGTHLQAGDPVARSQEVPEIFEGIISRYKTDGVPQLLAGDMNMDHGTDDYQRLLTITEMRDFPIDDKRPFTTDAENSWNRRPGKKPKRIDHVLLNPRGTSSTIVRQTLQRARRQHEGETIDLSNHYGVVAEVHLEKPGK